MIMFCFYYLLTDRQPLEVAAKNCLFGRYVHVQFSLRADLLPSELVRYTPRAEITDIIDILFNRMSVNTQ